MDLNHRTTDSLPISRRTVIINTGLAAAAIARRIAVICNCNRPGGPWRYAVATWSRPDIQQVERWNGIHA
jgi:hypothetical protein